MSQAQAAVHHTVEITNSSHAFRMSALRHLVKTVGFPLCRRKLLMDDTLEYANDR